MMLQDLSPSRVVAASAGHARAVVASTTHLLLDKAGPWTVLVPTHGRIALTSYGIHATAWVLLQPMMQISVCVSYAYSQL